MGRETSNPLNMPQRHCCCRLFARQPGEIKADYSSFFTVSSQPAESLSDLHAVQEQIWMGWGGLLAGCTELWECYIMKKSLAHVLSYSVLERLCSLRSRDLAMSQCPIITLISNQQVLQMTGCATLLARFFKYECSQEMLLTMWVTDCSKVNKLTGKRVWNHRRRGHKHSGRYKFVSFKKCSCFEKSKWSSFFALMTFYIIFGFEDQT